MPQIKERVDAEFGVDAKLTDPDECVAKGAAIYAMNEAYRQAVEDYEMRAVKANTAYTNAVLLTATKAVRAFGYRYNVDAMKAEEFLNSKAFADKVVAHGQYLDTTARLASFVSSVYKDVSEKRVTVTKKTPLTISEIKLLLQMVAVGFMTREEARAKVAKGK